MVSVVCVRTQPIVVLEAACLTLSVTIAVTIFAATTDKDFTVMGPILHICGLVFCTAGLFLGLIGYQTGLLYATIGVILFSFYLLWDT